MAEIKLYIAEGPLCLEKVTLVFMGNEWSRTSEERFEKVDAGMHAVVDQLCATLIASAIDQLEAFGEESDYIDLLYLHLVNVYHTASGEQLLQQPFSTMEGALIPVMMEVCEPIAEKFYEELTNQLEALTDDEIFSTYYLDDQQMVIQLSAPVVYEEVLSIDRLVRQYHETLQIIVEKIYPYLV